MGVSAFSSPNMIYVICLLAFVVAGALSFGFTPLVKIFAQKIGAMDVPKDDRRMHTVPIPRLGGLAIFFGFIFSVLIFSEIDAQTRGILLGAVVIVVLGVVDDIMPLKAWIKFIVQILAALIPVLSGTVVRTITNPFFFSDTLYLDLGKWAIPLTVLWIVGITNAVNLIDGLDGLAVGVSSIASLSVFAIALLVSEPYVAIVMAALSGACIGFMPYNVNPAKIFMGDTGATFLGYILAVISVQGLFKFYAVVSFAVPFLILGLPIFDTGFAILRRVLTGKNPMSADRGHVHHRLIDMGFSQKQSVAILYAMSGLLGLSAVVLTSEGPIKAMVLIIAVVTTVMLTANVIHNVDMHGGKQNQNDAEQSADPAQCDSERQGDPEQSGECEEQNQTQTQAQAVKDESAEAVEKGSDQAVKSDCKSEEVNEK